MPFGTNSTRKMQLRPRWRRTETRARIRAPGGRELEVIENQQEQVIVNVHEAMSALKDLKVRLTEAEGEPDWTDPRVRKEMTKAMRSIPDMGTIGISSFQSSELS